MKDELMHNDYYRFTKVDVLLRKLETLGVIEELTDGLLTDGEDGFVPEDDEDTFSCLLPLAPGVVVQKGVDPDRVMLHNFHKHLVLKIMGLPQDTLPLQIVLAGHVAQKSEIDPSGLAKPVLALLQRASRELHEWADSPELRQQFSHVVVKLLAQLM